VKVFKFAAGLAVGYVLGSRAGRDKYEQIVAAARKAQDHPAVGQVQQKAKDLLGTTGDSAPAGTDAVPVEVPTTAASTGPVPRARRRRPKNALAVPDATTDPLT
jgi:hypothetical protein